MTCGPTFNYERQNNRTNTDGGGEREMRRHACGEDAKSWRPEFEKKERLEKKERKKVK